MFRKKDNAAAALAVTKNSYVPVDSDFVLKDNAGEVEIDTNFAAQSFWKEVVIRFFRKKSGVFGTFMILFITLMAIVGPNMNSYSYSGQNLEQKSEALSPEELTEAVSDLKAEGEELRDRMEESLEKMPESSRFSAKGEALEEETSILEDTLDLLDELLSLLEDSGETGAEDAAAILAEAAEYMGDVLQ